MIAIPRDLARRFRAVAAKCREGRRRGPDPPVLVRAAGGTLTLTVRQGDVVLCVTAPAADTPDAAVVVPLGALAAAGRARDAVELAPGRARWADRGVPRELAFPVVRPGKAHEMPPDPDDWSPVSSDFLVAMHEAGRAAAREPGGRFALHRVRVRGGTGQVVGSDSVTAVVFAGFPLRFADDLLLPAVPAFGGQELASQDDVRAGVADGFLAVAAGPWTVWLAVDRLAKYPDVDAVTPRRTASSTVVSVDEGDAAAALDALPALPGGRSASPGEDGDRAVTLDCTGRTPVLRAAGPGGAVGLPLPRSGVTGPPARVALDRGVLARGLRLGCRTVRLTGALKPAVLARPGLTVLAMPLDAACVVGPTPDRHPVHPESRPEPPRSPSMPHDPKPVTNGHAPPNPAPPGDPLGEAEGLRAALADAHARAARLVGLLKGRRREQKALASVWTSLRSLRLDPE